MRLRAMVLEWNESAQTNVWVDYWHRCESIESLTKRLKRGVREGHWIGWRIITIDAEGWV